MDDRVRKTILSRRAQFIAAAITTMGVNTTGCGAQTCLDTAYFPDVKDDTADGGDAISSPEACLGAPWDGGVDTGTSDAAPDGDADTGPTVCLNVAPDSSPDSATG